MQMQASMARYRLHCLTHLAAHILLLILVLAESTAAGQENTTIDDAYQDQIEGLTLRYLAADGWIVGNLCPGCSAQPEVAFAYNGTWHDATSMHDDKLQRVIEFNFTGVAVYAYFIVANNFSFSTLTNLTFSMDGGEAGTFVHLPSKDAIYEYKILGYSSTNLKNVPHSLNISTTGSSPSLVLFDYFVYTTDVDLADPTTGNGLSSESVSTSTLTTSISTLTSTSTLLGSTLSSGFQSRTVSSEPPVSTSTVISTRAPAKHSQSHILADVLIVVIIAAIVILVLTCLRHKRWPSFFKRFRRRHCDNPHNREAVSKTSIDAPPVYTPGNVDLSASAESNMPVPAAKGQPLQMYEIQRRVEELRSELGQYSSGPGEFGAWQRDESSVTTLRPSDSASRVQGPDDASVPRMMKQINALRAQIQHWEGQLAVDSRLPPNRSSDESVTFSG